MSTIQENEFAAAPPDTVANTELLEGERSSHSRRSPSTQKGRNAGFDLVLPVDDPINVHTALEHAIKMAKTYGARIVLMYVTNQKAIPKEYADYASTERIQDYASTYFASLGESTIAKLRRRVEEEGVECASYPSVGSLADAIKACQQNVKVLMLILTLQRKPTRRILTRKNFKLKMTSNLKVPVLLIPV